MKEFIEKLKSKNYVPSLSPQMTFDLKISKTLTVFSPFEIVGLYKNSVCRNVEKPVFWGKNQVFDIIKFIQITYNRFQVSVLRSLLPMCYSH